MILNVICYRNKKMKCYTTPIFNAQTTENIVIGVSRACSVATPEKKKELASCDLYCLGTFDDETGKFIQEEPTLLLNLGDCLNGNEDDK